MTILNPAPATPLDPDLIDASHWLIPNETEFAILAGLDRFDPEDDGPIVAYARRIAPRLVLTLGARGAAIVRDDGERDVERIPATRVTAVDTNWQESVPLLFNWNGT